MRLITMPWHERRLSRYLTLRDLHVLMTVAKCGSMGRAAVQLAVSQPAISKAIADMERSLGVPLLDRSPRGVETTIYARALLEHGTLAFHELKEASRHIEFLAHPTSGDLRIGSTIAIATGFISAVVEKLSRQYLGSCFTFQPVKPCRALACCCFVQRTSRSSGRTEQPLEPSVQGDVGRVDGRGVGSSAA